MAAGSKRVDDKAMINAVRVKRVRDIMDRIAGRHESDLPVVGTERRRRKPILK
jgi:hypothetical protein